MSIDDVTPQQWSASHLKWLKDKNEMVNSPDHYTVGGIEAIDYLQAKSTPAEFAGYLRLNCLKYLSRAGYKGNTLEDYKKAAWYLNKLIEVTK
jgi:hypothetical protein